MGTTELARSLGFPLSGTHRLLATLKLRGFVTQDPASRKFTLGLKILELGTRLVDKLDIRKVALPVMLEMRDRCDETIGLHVVDGLERVCIERLESQQGVRRVISVGSRLSLHAGASSKLLLAYLPRNQQDAVLGRALERYSEHTISDPDELRASLEEIRRQGYACSAGEHVADAGTVAAPIWGHGGREVLAALSILVPLMRFAPERRSELLSMVVEGADRISSILGGCTEGISP